MYKEVALVVVTLILFANAVSPIILLFTFTKVPPARLIPQQSGEINVALPTTSIPLIILFEILNVLNVPPPVLMAVIPPPAVEVTTV